ncbi:MAG TPA: S8 family serine peptidase [Ignavibacteria bacterium]|nr:S8 family serine peptidase [Ignavibacteria bacterium]HMQ99254.1 S8 family serine peptidase [Ignavibacteria bacterium]
MRKLQIVLLLIFSFQLTGDLFSQKLNPETTEYRYWIFFKDKGDYKPGDILTPGSEGYNIAKAELTEKALWRRSKVLAPEMVVNYNDIPVKQEYIDAIVKLGLTPHAVSKWFNGVSIKAKKDKLDEIKKLPFVEKIEGVGFLEFVKVTPSGKAVNELDKYYSAKTKLDYGYSYWQNEQINVPRLHDFGVTGYGVTVGMCDDGFNWRKHEALMTRNVKGEYDWIFKDDSVQYQTQPNQMPGDSYDQDGHGTSTMSTLGGYFPGQLIGPAFDVEFYLSKTEAGASETPVEEDFWLEGVEWMESQGVEVISSSLIYKPFDLPNNQYTYKDMNGKTTVIVRAADLAAKLGVVVVNSMGNEYQTTPPSIVSPPDGENVIAVGAVDSAGRIAYFSSNGPTSDGRIKPDIVAMGVDVYAAASYSFTYDTAGYSYVSGTSFSGPLTAGVCALILSVHPELTPLQVLEALKMTANKKDSPGNVYGWGLINAYNAALYYGMIISNKPEITEVGENQSISISVLSNNSVVPESVKMFYSMNGGEFTERQMVLTEKSGENNSGKYTATVPFDVRSENVKFYFKASDDKDSRTAPFGAPGRFFYFDQETKKLVIY